MRILFCALLICSVARADDPKYEYKDPGKNIIDQKKPTIWQANMTLGLTWIAGNAQSLGFSATGFASMKHWNNELSLNVGGAYVNAGFSNAFGTGGPIDDHKQVAGNWLLKLRYDRYFLKYNTAFAYFQGSGDPFAGVCADTLDSENSNPAATTAPAKRAGRRRPSGFSVKNRQAEATRGKRIIHPSQ